jgi:hypothetical protein
MQEASNRDSIAKRTKLTSAVFAVPRRIHSHISRRTTSELYGLAKTAIVVMTVALPTVIGFVIVMQAMLHTPVLITPISVPDSYAKSGYSSEAATQRLLDEIANLNNISLGGKPKTDVGDTNFLGEVASTQIQSGLIDARTIQTLIRRFFGRDIIQLSGEITVRKQGEEEISRLRLRRSPGRETLIDVESTEGPDGLFVKGAMNLLERIDPEIAAGIYLREYRDAEAARRVLSVALTSSDPTVKKFAYNLKSFMLAADGRIDEALAASERVRSFGGDEFPADIQGVCTSEREEIRRCAGSPVAKCRSFSKRTEHKFYSGHDLSGYGEECRSDSLLSAHHRAGSQKQSGLPAPVGNAPRDG